MSWPHPGARILLLAVLAAGSPARADTEASCGVTRVPVPAHGVVATVAFGRGGWVEVLEHGVDVELATPGGMLIAGVPVPPRLGWSWVEVARGDKLELRRTQLGEARSDVDVRLHCRLTRTQRAERDWVIAASPWATPPAAGAAPRDTATVDAALAARLADAPTKRTRALALHLLAQRAMLSARTTEAADAFATAQAAWLVADGAPDLERAFAALVARAEELNRKGRYDGPSGVLAIARSLPGAPDANSYYGIRLESARCLALQYLARLDEAAGCYAWVLAAYERRGERIEHAAITVDYAYLQRQRGDRVLSRTQALRASERAVGAQADLVRGRAHLLLADLAIDAGDMADALRELRAADHDFALARAVRWQVNALLKAADLWSVLGAAGDSRAAVEAALALLDHEDAPARRAVALLQRAKLALDDGDDAAASGDAHAAGVIYHALAMPLEEAQAAAFECRASRGRAAACAVRSGADPVADALVAAEVALAHGEAARVDSLLATIATKDPEQATALIRLRVAAALARGQRERATAIARAAALESRAAAASFDNRVLATLARQRVDAAVALGLGIFATELDERPRPLDPARATALGEWIGTTLGETTRRAPTASDAARAFDAARGITAGGGALPPGIAERLALLESGVTRIMLPPPRDVLAALHTALAPRRADAMLAVLPAGDWFIVLARRGSGPLFAWRVPAAALLQPGPAVAALPAGLDARANAIAAALLHTWPGSVGVERWWVLDRGPAATIPWSALPLRDGSLLIEHATVMRIEPTLDAPAVPAAQPVALFANPPVVGAANLEAIAREARSLASMGVHVVDRAGRDDVLAALGASTRLVTIATHGEGGGDRLGGSGIWLGAARAEYLSGVELLTRGVRAGTVLLDACAVAAGTRGADLSLARSLVLAGAQSSVAPLWDIGDEAAAAFAFEFHAASARGADVATAMRVAQLRIRSNRAWRRPADWAPWTALQRTSIAATAHAP